MTECIVYAYPFSEKQDNRLGIERREKKLARSETERDHTTPISGSYII